MKIAFIASEVVPFAKTGGLADVSGSLPKEIKELGVEIGIVIGGEEKGIRPLVKTDLI